MGRQLAKNRHRSAQRPAIKTCKRLIASNPKMLVGMGHSLRLKARPRRRDHAALDIAHSTSRTSSALPGRNIRTSQRRYARRTTRSARDPTPKEPTEYQGGQASSGRSPDNADSAPTFSCWFQLRPYPYLATSYDRYIFSFVIFGDSVRSLKLLSFPSPVS
jgi:hypothetical protein